MTFEDVIKIPITTDSNKNLMEKAFQSAFGNEDLLFQVLDLSPIHIEIFAPDGTTVFANRAVLEKVSLDDMSGRYEAKSETVQFHNLKLPVQDVIEKFGSDDR